MRKALGVTLGILTAVGGFLDIGDIVTASVTGARFRMSLVWAVLLGLVGIIIFAEMAGRVATMSHRPVFDLVRERIGARLGLANLVASFFINFLTLAAEVAGVAIALQLASDVNYLAWIPVVGLLSWFMIWRVRFERMERIVGLAGLALVVMAVALWQLHPDWSSLWHSASHPTVKSGEGTPTYFYYAIALFGATMTPYEVFFFSSGAVEERWTRSDLVLNRANVYIGFPLGGALTLSLMGLAAVLFAPRNITVENLSQAALPTAFALGKIGLALLLVGFFAATFSAALETALSAGYTVGQYFGWQWGKRVAPREAGRFHVVVLLTLVGSVLLALTSIDPVKLTEYTVVLAAAALPLTYFPILVVANDPEFMGDKVNSRVSNAIATVYLGILIVVSIATIPLMIATKGGA
jgi:manganese transport protein